MRWMMLATLAWLPAAALASEPERPWTLAVTGGITTIPAAADQPFAAISLRRDFNDGWVKGEFAYIDSGAARGLTVPADTLLGTLSSGAYIGDLGLEAYVSYGGRRFRAGGITTDSGATVSVDRNGSLFGAGGSISYDLTLADRWFLTPYVGVDYNRVDFAVALVGPGGRTIGTSRGASDGTTGAVGAGLTHVFAGEAGSIGVSAGFSASSNIASVVRLGQSGGSGTPRLLASPDQSGEWGELGASLSFNLGKAVTADLSVLQTVGFPFGDTTAGTAGLRFRF